MNDVARKNELNRRAAVRLGLLLEQPGVSLRENLQEPFPAGRDVVRQNINAVEARHGKNRVPLIFQLALAIPGFDDAEFPLENLSQKIPIAASRLKKARVNPLGLLFDEIEHGVDLTRTGQHLAVIGNPLPGNDLFLVNNWGQGFLARASDSALSADGFLRGKSVPMKRGALTYAPP